MTATKALRALHTRIPATTCPRGCGKCCGPVPVSPAEARVLGIAGPLTPTTPDGTCQFHSPVEGCTVYDRRPLLCRLFGASDALPCPVGCVTPNGRLPVLQTRAVMKEYRAVVFVKPARKERKQ